ncbi:M20/M25/M40 family metallo-hydrolase [Actinospica durhamensis]|uniref:M20/M25/M40 family metallo-hydrolase n=1 Tax=Actinospica durhamensis TaxID=1508375 RepID=A0A941EL20_9ACTN|nr:M20/M25/M40 family metallo-hydrolase [Actinospica durhamensis]MBR7833281.1 M20/M25/M40 family metallo-hydrolase [Actinospica durhamensis]
MSTQERYEEGVAVGPMAAAQDDREAVLDLAQRLVRIRSRAGVDDYEPILGTLEGWLAGAGLAYRRLHGEDGAVVGLVCEIRGGRPGPRIVLDACVDTAPFGDLDAWTHPPTAGVIEDGWLHGRGSADSKTGAAIFLHLAARVAQVADRLAGDLVVLLDADEHTGGFGGAKAYMAGGQAPGRVDGVMIGYPGADHVVVGGRGVLRLRLDVHGVAAHSGGRAASPNAISKAAALIAALDEPLPGADASWFGLAPKLSVTEIHAGEGYSVTPDLAHLHIDVRLTPDFDQAAAVALLRERVAAVDGRWPGTAATDVHTVMAWPPYRLPEDHPLATALLKAAHDVGLQTAPKVAGPSNIGNYLAGLGVAATAGFGVEYVGLHATDERIRIASIVPVQAAYHQAVLDLLG